MDDPREEAARILSSMKESLIGDWAKDMMDLTRLTAHLYNNMLLMRR